MFLLQQFLPGILAAALICGGVLTISGWLCARNPWGAAVAIGLAYAGGHAVVTGWPSLPPHTAAQWLAWVALAGLIAGILDAFLHPGKQVRAFLWLVVCAGLFRLLVQPRFRHGWSTAEGWLWVAGLAIVAGSLTWSLERVARRQTTAFSLPLTLTIVAAGTSATLMLSGSLLLGQLASILAAAVAMMFALTLLTPRILPDGRGVSPVSALLLTSLWICGYFYAELPATSALLLLLAPVSGMIAFAGLTGWKATLVHASIVSVAVFAAVFLAWRASPPFPS